MPIDIFGRMMCPIASATQRYTRQDQQVIDLWYSFPWTIGEARFLLPLSPTSEVLGVLFDTSRGAGIYLARTEHGEMSFDDDKVDARTRAEQDRLMVISGIKIEYVTFETPEHVASNRLGRQQKRRVPRQQEFTRNEGFRAWAFG